MRREQLKEALSIQNRINRHKKPVEKKVSFEDEFKLFTSPNDKKRKEASVNPSPSPMRAIYIASTAFIKTTAENLHDHLDTNLLNL